MQERKPILIGSASFANGERFAVFQSPVDGRCLIKNLRTEAVSRAGSPAKAWASIRYMARVGQASERTAGVEAIEL